MSRQDHTYWRSWVEETGFFIPHARYPPSLCVLVWLLTAVINNMTKNLGGGKWLLGLYFQVTVHYWGKSEGRDSIRGHRGTLLTGLFPMACYLLSHSLGLGMSLGTVPPTMVWALLPQSPSKKMPFRHAYWSNLIYANLQLKFPLPRWL